jgi:hypothetical protein
MTIDGVVTITSQFGNIGRVRTGDLFGPGDGFI